MGSEILQPHHRVRLEVPHASGLVVLDATTLLVVDDDRGICVADASGHAELISSNKRYACLEDLEGICLDADRGRVLVVSEKSGDVIALALTREDGAFSLGEPSRIGALESIGKKSNKGWEGLACVPSDRLGASAFLVAVHESKPRRVGLFSLPHLENVAVLKLPKGAKDELKDLSDVEYMSDRDSVLLLSDASSAVVEVKLRCGESGWSFDVVAKYGLEVGAKEKPEGLCIGPDGVLWMVTDGDPHLYAYRW